MSGICGRPLIWARDLSVLSALSTVIAVQAVWVISSPVPLVVGSALSGALLGAAMPGLMERLRRRVPLPGLVGLSALLGAVWWLGLAWVGSASGQISTIMFVEPGWMLTIGALFGALFFATFWLPYTLVTVMGWPRLGVLAVTSLLIPVWWVTAAMVASMIFPPFWPSCTMIL